MGQQLIYPSLDRQNKSMSRCSVGFTSADSHYQGAGGMLSRRRKNLLACSWAILRKHYLGIYQDLLIKNARTLVLLSDFSKP